MAAESIVLSAAGLMASGNMCSDTNPRHYRSIASAACLSRNLLPLSRMPIITVFRSPSSGIRRNNMSK